MLHLYKFYVCESSVFEHILMHFNPSFVIGHCLELYQLTGRKIKEADKLKQVRLWD